MLVISQNILENILSPQLMALAKYYIIMVIVDNALSCLLCLCEACSIWCVQWNGL